MIVKIFPNLDKEAWAYGVDAGQFFQSGIEFLQSNNQKEVLANANVRPLLGGQKGTFEIILSRFRTVFTCPLSHIAVIIGFFKKEGMKLKRTELHTISLRKKTTEQYYETQR